MNEAAAIAKRTAVPAEVLRAWFAVAVLVFAVATAARRYIDTSFTNTALNPGGDPWMAGEWLINYGGGFVRRGLFGQLFLEYAPSGLAGLWVLFAFQMACYGVVLVYGLQVLHRTRYSWSSIALVCSPAGLAFIGWVPSIDAAFRKELLTFVVFALLAWSRSRRRSRPAVIVLTLAALAVYVLAVFSWEPSALLLPAVLYLLLKGGVHHPELEVFRRSAAAVFIVVAGLGAVMSALVHGDVSTADAICDSVRAHGFTGPSLCSGGERMGGGAIEAIGWTSYKTSQDLAIALPVYAGFVPLIALALLPTVASRWFRENWKWAAFIALGVLPLFFIVTDYGRWTHILVIALMFCITADDPADSYSRLWNPFGTILYIVAWGMPHWMGMAQFDTVWWPRLGVLAATTDTAIDRINRYSFQPTPPANLGTLDVTGRFLFGTPAFGWDSWHPMQEVMAYLHSGGTELYQTIFFDRGIKFQYFPSSLLFVEPAYLFSPSNIAWPMNVLGWVTVAGTAVVIFLLLLHLAATTTLVRLSGRSITFLLVAAFAATVTFRPVVQAWDLGQAQALVNFLCTLSLYAYLRGRRPLSGIALALACLLKPQLGLFAVWGLVRREWGFLGGLVGTATVGVVISIARYGLQAHFDYFKVLSFLSQRGESYYPNQTVNGLLHRWLQTSDSLNFDIAGFPEFNSTVYAGSMIATLAFSALALFVAFRGRKSSTAPNGSVSSVAATLDFAIAATCFTVASPIAWEHHYGVLLPAYAVTGFLAARLKKSIAVPVMACLAVSYALVISGIWPYVLPFANTPLNFLISYVFFAVLLLLACMLVVRRELARETSALQAAAAGRHRGDPVPPQTPEADHKALVAAQVGSR